MCAFTSTAITDKLRDVKAGDTVHLHYNDGSSKGGLVTDAKRGRMGGGVILSFDGGGVFNSGAMSRVPVKVTVTVNA